MTRERLLDQNLPDMRKFYLTMIGFCLLGIALGLFAGWTTGITAGIVGGLLGCLCGAFLGFSLGDQVADRVVHAGERGLSLTGSTTTMLGGVLGLVGGAYAGGWLHGMEIMGALSLAGALAGVYVALARN